MKGGLALPKRGRAELRHKGWGVGHIKPRGGLPLHSHNDMLNNITRIYDRLTILNDYRQWWQPNSPTAAHRAQARPQQAMQPSLPRLVGWTPV